LQDGRAGLHAIATRQRHRAGPLDLLYASGSEPDYLHKIERASGRFDSSLDVRDYHPVVLGAVLFVQKNSLTMRGTRSRPNAKEPPGVVEGLEGQSASCALDMIGDPRGQPIDGVNVGGIHLGISSDVAGRTPPGMSLP